MSNIINAIINISKQKNFKLRNVRGGGSSMNRQGTPFEAFIKDAFANSFDKNIQERNRLYEETFSYLGGANTPPDCILKCSDAIEIKKVEYKLTDLALNSSYPKRKLLITDKRISNACKTCESWKEKDILYIIGHCKIDTVRKIFAIYGLNYCASSEYYENIFNKIKESVNSTPDINFSTSNELGHINGVDPLGITYMRVRGMWGIKNPWKVFSDYVTQENDDIFQFVAIIDKSKWNKLNNKNLLKNNKSITYKTIKINNPDNPAKLDEAILIEYKTPIK